MGLQEGWVLPVSADLQVAETLILLFISAKGFLHMPGQTTQPFGQPLGAARERWQHLYAATSVMCRVLRIYLCALSIHSCTG